MCEKNLVSTDGIGDASGCVSTGDRFDEIVNCQRASESMER